MNRPLRFLLPVLLFTAFTLSARLGAVAPVPFAESMSFSFKVSGSGAASMNLHDETGSAYQAAFPTGPLIESDLQVAQMRPGKSYTLDMWCGGPTYYQMSFTAPNGYAVFVDGVQTDLVQGSTSASWYLRYYTVELRPVSTEAGGKWGGFSGVKMGKSISWEVGLGLLRTGRSAGSILFKELELSSTSATRGCLYYADPPANVGQIVVVKDGPSNQRLRQIVTPVGFTDLVDITGGYEIRLYDWAQVTSWNGTLYSFSGSPWKTIRVESPVNDQLKITETEGSVIRVSQLTGSGSTGITGGTITTSGGYTIHTFNASGTLTIGGSGLSGVDYLAIGGGGGGSFGGGGAGSLEYQVSNTLAAGSYPVTIGAGGAAETNGGSSTFNGTTAYGGGHGASGSTAPAAGGCSGGGCANNNTGAPPTWGLGSNIHWGGGGDNGGNGWRGGGGGGTGGDGLGLNNSSGSLQGTGGAGLANSITGTSVTYAGGGAGNNSSPLSGGTGGGGNSNGAGQTGSAGAPNTGSGGGGGDNGYGPSGGAGGSGIVIIRYPTANAGSRAWTLQEGDGTTWLRTTKHTFTAPAVGQRDDLVEVRTGGTTGTLVAKTKYHYVNQAWGEELDSVIADPDVAALTTTYAYYTTSTDKGNYRKVKSVTAPTGGWTAYTYYDDWNRRGRLQYQYQPWLDLPATSASASTTTGRVFY